MRSTSRCNSRNGSQARSQGNPPMDLPFPRYEESRTPARRTTRRSTPYPIKADVMPSVDLAVAFRRRFLNPLLDRNLCYPERCRSRIGATTLVFRRTAKMAEAWPAFMKLGVNLAE